MKNWTIRIIVAALAFGFALTASVVYAQRDRMNFGEALGAKVFRATNNAAVQVHRAEQDPKTSSASKPMVEVPRMQEELRGQKK